MNLSDVIERTPGLRLIRCKVTSVYGDLFSATYLGGIITNIGALDQYNPAPGDIAVVIVWPKGGYLAIGSHNGSGPPSTTVPWTPVTLTVNAEGVSTCVKSATGAVTWLGGVLQQEPDRALCWFYDSGLYAPLGGGLIASFEIEVTRTSGGPPEFLLHGNPGAAGELVMATPTWYLPDDLPAVGVPTWVPLPVGWAEMLVNGQASGVGIGLGQHTGTYTGTGRMRFTTI